MFDVEIDKVNKPYLPMASGEISMSGGITLVIITALASLALGAASGSAPLLWTLGISLGLGILYSMDLPFMRWKRFPWMAAACILAVRALIVQLGEQQQRQLKRRVAEIARHWCAHVPPAQPTSPPVTHTPPPHSDPQAFTTT